MLRLLDPRSMEGFVGLTPTCCVPDGFAVTASDMSSPQWLSLSTAARPILLLVQGVLTMSHMHQAGLLKEDSDLDACKQNGAQVICTNLDRMRLQQAAACASDSKRCCRSHLHAQSLRSVLLLLKVAGLLSSLKLRNLELEHATDALWTAAVGASVQVSEDATLLDKYADTNHDQHVLLLLLVQTLRPLLRQVVKDKTSPRGPLRLCWACRCLRRLLPSSLPSLLQAVAPSIVAGQVCL